MEDVLKVAESALNTLAGDAIESKNDILKEVSRLLVVGCCGSQGWSVV